MPDREIYELHVLGSFLWPISVHDFTSFRVPHPSFQSKYDWSLDILPIPIIYIVCRDNYICRCWCSRPLPKQSRDQSRGQGAHQLPTTSLASAQGWGRSSKSLAGMQVCMYHFSNSCDLCLISISWPLSAEILSGTSTEQPHSHHSSVFYVREELTQKTLERSHVCHLYTSIPKLTMYGALP